MDNGTYTFMLISDSFFYHECNLMYIINKSSFPLTYDKDIFIIMIEYCMLVVILWNLYLYVCASFLAFVIRYMLHETWSFHFLVSNQFILLFLTCIACIITTPKYDKNRIIYVKWKLFISERNRWQNKFTTSWDLYLFIIIMYDNKYWENIDEYIIQ